MKSSPPHCPPPRQFLATGNCRSGRSGLRPSLVRGDSPRNAPLTPLHTPSVGSNVALRNQRPVAPPPCLRNSSVSPTRRVHMPPRVRVPRQSRPQPSDTAPAVSCPLTPAPCPCPLQFRPSLVQVNTPRNAPWHPSTHAAPRRARNMAPATTHRRFSTASRSRFPNRNGNTDRAAAAFLGVVNTDCLGVVGAVGEKN